MTLPTKVTSVNTSKRTKLFILAALSAFALTGCDIDPIDDASATQSATT